MAYAKQPHHKGSYQTQAKRLRDRANADPATTCRRCHRTIDEIRRSKPKAVWTAGHVMDGVPNSPLEPECSCCNFGAGARLGNQRRRKTRRRRLQW